MPSSQASLDAYLAKLPLEQQVIAREFPPGMRLDLNGVSHWVIGYGTGVLVISPTDPHANYDGAVKSQFNIPVARVRRGLVRQ